MRRVRREDLVDMVIMTLLSSTPIAFVTFDYMFPNISTPSFEKNLMASFLVSMLVGIPSGYFSRRTDMAMMTVISYVSFGYLLALGLYSAPYTIYNLELILPGFYYTLFFRFTVILLFLYILGGFVGTIFGQIVRDSIRREETSLEFPE